MSTRALSACKYVMGASHPAPLCCHPQQSCHWQQLHLAARSAQHLRQLQAALRLGIWQLPADNAVAMSASIAGQRLLMDRMPEQMQHGSITKLIQAFSRGNIAAVFKLSSLGIMLTGTELSALPLAPPLAGGGSLAGLLAAPVGRGCARGAGAPTAPPAGEWTGARPTWKHNARCVLSNHCLKHCVKPECEALGQLKHHDRLGQHGGHFLYRFEMICIAQRHGARSCFA